MKFSAIAVLSALAVSAYAEPNVHAKKELNARQREFDSYCPPSTLLLPL